MAFFCYEHSTDCPTVVRTLFLKKNITVHGSYSSYMALKSGTAEMSTKYITAKFLSWSATPARTCNHFAWLGVGMASWTCAEWLSTHASTELLQGTGETDVAQAYKECEAGTTQILRPFTSWIADWNEKVTPDMQLQRDNRKDGKSSNASASNSKDKKQSF